MTAVVSPEPRTIDKDKYYHYGEPILFIARIKNYGVLTQSTILYRVKLYFIDSSGKSYPVYEEKGALRDVYLSAGMEIADTLTALYLDGGRYSVHICTMLEGDEDSANNCMIIGPIHVLPDSGSYDIALGDPVQPEYSPRPERRYRVNRPIPIAYTLTNRTEKYLDRAPVRIQIKDASGMILFSEIDNLGPMGKEENIRSNLNSYTPLAPGLYTIVVFSELANERDRSNDTAQWNFIVVRDGIELAAGDPSIFRNRPDLSLIHPSGTPIPVQATILHNGTRDADSVRAGVRIEASGRVVYEEEIVVPKVKATDAHPQIFNDFVPANPGWYRATATVYHFDDVEQWNDTVQWEFQVSPPSSVQPEYRDDVAPTESLTLLPNPARDNVTIIRQGRHRDDARVVLRDMLGRGVRTLDYANGDGVEMQVRDLPAGVYIVILEDRGGSGIARTLMIKE